VSRAARQDGVPFGGDAATARGGALYVGTGARATVYSTLIEGNEGVVSSVLWQLGTGQARIDSSLLTDNLGTLLVGNNLRNSELVLSWSTVTRNRLASGNYLVSASNETGGRVKVFGSVLGEAITCGVYPLGAPLTADCVARDPAMAALSGTASREFQLAAPLHRLVQRTHPRRHRAAGGLLRPEPGAAGGRRPRWTDGHRRCAATGQPRPP
jgi:hypothetical protein